MAVPIFNAFLSRRLGYIDTSEPSISPLTQSPNTPSPVSSITTISASNISEEWNTMSRTSPSRAVSATSDLEIEPIARHPAYYIPSGDIVFLAGAQLFRVHRYFFVRESLKFQDLLSIPAPSGAKVMGSSDSCAIRLSDATQEEFESFLWLFYNNEYDYEAPLEKWTAILRLAHLWQFPKIKALATRKLDRIDIEPVDKAVMAREYQVDPAYSWLEQANTAIGEREEAITESEGGRLGLDAVVRLAGLRERIRKTRFEQEKNTLLQVYASPRPVSPNPSILDGGLELREEDAIVKSPAFSRPCTPRSINASPLEYLPKSPAPVRDAELHAHPADEPVPPDNTLNSPFNVSVPPHSSFGTYPSTFWSVPVPVTDSLNSAYEPTDSLEPSSFGRAKGKKGKKGKKSEEESDSIPRMWG